MKKIIYLSCIGCLLLPLNSVGIFTEDVNKNKNEAAEAKLLAQINSFFVASSYDQLSQTSNFFSQLDQVGMYENEPN